jgi:hypothetical protein
MRNSTCNHSALTVAEKLDCATRHRRSGRWFWASASTIIQSADRRGGDSRSRVPAFGRRYADAPAAVPFTATTGANFLHPAREACPMLRRARDSGLYARYSFERRLPPTRNLLIEGEAKRPLVMSAAGPNSTYVCHNVIDSFAPHSRCSATRCSVPKAAGPLIS